MSVLSFHFDLKVFQKTQEGLNYTRIKTSCDQKWWCSNKVNIIHLYKLITTGSLLQTIRGIQMLITDKINK